MKETGSERASTAKKLKKKSSSINAKSNLQVLQGSGVIAPEKLAVCHLPAVRTGQEGTTVLAIAQPAGSLAGSQKLALLEKWESKGSCGKNALPDLRNRPGLSPETDGERNPTTALL